MGSYIHTGSGTGTGNRKGRCAWRAVVQSLPDVQSPPGAELRGGLPEVLLGVHMGMGSGTGSRDVDRSTVHNATDTPDVHTRGSTQH